MWEFCAKWSCKGEKKNTERKGQPLERRQTNLEQRGSPFKRSAFGKGHIFSQDLPAPLSVCDVFSLQQVPTPLQWLTKCLKLYYKRLYLEKKKKVWTEEDSGNSKLSFSLWLINSSYPCFSIAFLLFQNVNCTLKKSLLKKWIFIERQNRTVPKASLFICDI